jgi:hypothetical protein
LLLANEQYLAHHVLALSVALDHELRVREVNVRVQVVVFFAGQRRVGDTGGLQAVEGVEAEEAGRGGYAVVVVVVAAFG